MVVSLLVCGIISGIPGTLCPPSSAGDDSREAAKGADRPPAGEAVEKRMQKLRRQYREVASDYHRYVPPGRLPSPSRSVREMYVALAGLQLAKARDEYTNSNVHSKSSGIKKCLKLAESFLQAEDPEEIPRRIEHGKYIESAYLSRNDQSPQPYFVYIPSSYPQAKDTYPLMLGLHGWVPSTSRSNPCLLPSSFVEMAEQNDVLLALPHGRRNTDFKYVGEVDVLRVLREMKKFYKVDPDRVYLTGVSMGGVGAWQIGAHYPDKFAGIAPISAQTDWFRFWHEHFGFPPRHKISRHLRMLFQANNPVDLAPNFRNLYSYTQQARNGFLGAGHAERMQRRLEKLGAPYDMRITTSRLGHYMYQEEHTWKKVFEQLLTRERNAAPKQVQYKSFTPRYDGVYWVDGIRLQEWGKAAEVHAAYTGKGRIEIETRNVERVEIDPPAGWKKPEEYRIAWNRKEIQKSAEDFEKQGALLLSKSNREQGGSDKQAKTFLKSHKLSGPIPDAFRSAFVAVRGTSGTEKADKRNRRLARAFTRDWARYAEGRVKIVRDKDVTEKLMKNRNLVLFGASGTNTIIAELAPHLPLRIKQKHIKLPDGRTFSGDDVGVLMIYPNPLANGRYIVVYQGVHWGEGCSDNHIFDRLADFTIFTEESVDPGGINKYRAAGFFDQNWQYDPDLTDFNGSLRRDQAGANDED